MSRSTLRRHGGDRRGFAERLDSSGIHASVMQSHATPRSHLIGHPFTPPLSSRRPVLVGRHLARALQQAMKFYASIGKNPILLRKRCRGTSRTALAALPLRRGALPSSDPGRADRRRRATLRCAGRPACLGAKGPSLAVPLRCSRGGIRHFPEECSKALRAGVSRRSAIRRSPPISRTARRGGRQEAGSLFARVATTESTKELSSHPQASARGGVNLPPHSDPLRPCSQRRSRRRCRLVRRCQRCSSSVGSPVAAKWIAKRRPAPGALSDDRPLVRLDDSAADGPGPPPPGVLLACRRLSTSRDRLSQVRRPGQANRDGPPSSRKIPSVGCRLRPKSRSSTPCATCGVSRACCEHRGRSAQVVRSTAPSSTLDVACIGADGFPTQASINTSMQARINPAGCSHQYHACVGASRMVATPDGRPGPLRPGRRIASDSAMPPRASGVRSRAVGP